MRNPRKSKPSSRVADPRLLLRQAQAHRSEHRADLAPQRLGVVAGAGDHDHEVVRVADELHGRDASATVLAACPLWAEGFPLACEVLVQAGKRDVGQQRREDAALGRPGPRVPADGVLGEDAGPQERLHQGQDALVPDPISHPAHEGAVVDLVEARRDVRLEHPVVVPAG